MAEQRDYWKIEEGSLPDLPLRILREIADPLAQKTSGLLEAKVQTTSEQLGWLAHRLSISAPTIDFELNVALLRHRAVDVYPVWAQFVARNRPPYLPARPGSGLLAQKGMWLPDSVYGESARPAVPEPPGEKLADAEGVRRWLENVIGSEEVLNTVQGLLATLKAA